FDAQIDVFADQNRMTLRLRFFDANGQRENTIVDRVGGKNGVAVFRRLVLLENDSQLSAVGQSDAFTQPACAAQTVKHARDSARVLPQLSRFALEPIYFFDDFNRQKDKVLIEAEERVGVVE